MSPNHAIRYVRAGVAFSAVCAAAFGALLLFAPDEVASALAPGSGPLTPLLGAALLGFGVMNWIARGAVLGGIYGRSVVAGNQTHLTIGGLLLVKQGIGAGTGSLAYWALAGAYVLGAIFFNYLTFFSSGIRREA